MPVPNDTEFTTKVENFISKIIELKGDKDLVHDDFEKLGNSSWVLAGDNLRQQSFALSVDFVFLALMDIYDEQGLLKAEFVNENQKATEESIVRRLLASSFDEFTRAQASLHSDQLLKSRAHKAFRDEALYENFYADGRGALLMTYLPDLIELVKLVKQIELQQSNDLVYTSGTEFTKQCFQEFQPLLQEQYALLLKQFSLAREHNEAYTAGSKVLANHKKEVSINEKHLDENRKKLEALKEVVVSATNVLKEPHRPEPLVQFDKAVEVHAKINLNKKQKMQIKCYEFAAAVCGKFGKQKKQEQYLTKIQDAYASKSKILIPGMRFFEAAIKATPNVTPNVDQSQTNKTTMKKGN